MTEIYFLKICNYFSLNNLLSMQIYPDSRSENLNKQWINELLPDPVLPTTPTFIIGDISNAIYFIAGYKFGRYRIDT